MKKVFFGIFSKTKTEKDLFSEKINKIICEFNTVILFQKTNMKATKNI